MLLNPGAGGGPGIRCPTMCRSRATLPPGTPANTPSPKNTHKRARTAGFTPTRVAGLQLPGPLFRRGRFVPGFQRVGPLQQRCGIAVAVEKGADQATHRAILLRHRRSRGAAWRLARRQARQRRDAGPPRLVPGPMAAGVSCTVCRPCHPLPPTPARTRRPPPPHLVVPIKLAPAQQRLQLARRKVVDVICQVVLEVACAIEGRRGVWAGMRGARPSKERPLVRAAPGGQFPRAGVGRAFHQATEPRPRAHL